MNANFARMPSREAMIMAGSIETFGMDIPETPYQKQLVQTFYPHYSPKTLHYTAPQKNELPKQPISTIKTDSGYRSYQVLDLPDFGNEYYQQNLDWGKQFLAVNLYDVCYVWNAFQKKIVGTIHHRHELRCVKWNPGGEIVATGQVDAKLLLTEVSEGAKKLLSRKAERESPIFSMDWRANSELTLGTTSEIRHFDARKGKFVKRVHTDGRMLISMEWSLDRYQLAVGSNDDSVSVYDIRNGFDEPVVQYAHLAGVKALQWMPGSSFLLSGGGTKDRTIKLFDVAQNKELSQLDVEAQVCSLAWLNKQVIVLGLGFSASQAGNVQFLSYDPTKHTLKKMEANNDQKGRISNVSKDPNSSEFCSASSDETLHFWEPKPQITAGSGSKSIFDYHSQIR